MEGEVELVTEPRTSGWCNDVTVSGEVEEKPESLDEHGVDDCIKDWQLGLRSYEAPQEPVTVRPSSRRTVRTASTTKPDSENTKPASTDTAAPRTETRSGSTSPSRLESSSHAGSSVENIGLPGADDNCSKDSRLGRRVSFSESSRSSSQNEAPSTAQDSEDCAPEPAKCAKPVGPREGIVPGASPLPLPELDLLRQSQQDRGSPFRHSCAQVRPLDPIGEGSCKFDSSSRDFMSGPLANSHSQEFEVDSNLNSPSILLRCNARRQHDEEEDDDEDFKVGLFCGTRGLAYTNASRGDFVRLLSKLCVAVPLSKQSASKVSQDSRSSGREVCRSSSISSQVCSWENNQNPNDDYIVFGRQNTLKLLCERCTNESTPSYNVHKPRKIRDHEPHQHFYKTISKTLDRKLRS